MKIPQLNGNMEQVLLSSMIVYTFIGILFPYSSIHLYQVRVRDTPPPTPGQRVYQVDGIIYCKTPKILF